MIKPRIAREIRISEIDKKGPFQQPPPSMRKLPYENYWTLSKYLKVEKRKQLPAKKQPLFFHFGKLKHIQFDWRITRNLEPDQLPEKVTLNI